MIKVFSRFTALTALVLLFQSCFSLCVMGAEWVPGELLVKYKPDVSAVNMERMNKTMGITSVRVLQAANRDWRVVKFDPLEDVQEKAKEYIKSGLVQYAEPNYLVYTDEAQTNIPNDPAFTSADNSYSFDITDTTYAWDTITDASSIIVAVVDTGVNYNHEDLKDNMWVNPNPTIGDIHGIQIVWGAKAGDPMDDGGHGTHVAGTIGARGNNGLGTAGVAWKVQIMACKALYDEGIGSDSDVVECMAYAREHGAKVINLSFGSEYSSRLEREEFSACQTAGILVVCAAGNEASDNEEIPHYPSNYCTEFDNVISVGSSTREDEISSFSNYGKNSVQLFAPGNDIYSTYLGYNPDETVDNSYYESASGTSMAVPLVTGAAALYMAAYPDAGYREIRDLILSSVDLIPSLSEKCETGGRINVNNLFNEPLLRIRAQPKTQVGIVGGTVSFFTRATGGDIAYQWYKDGTAIHNATNSSYTIPDLKASDAGSYTVVVSNGKDSVESDAAELSLCTPAVNASFVDGDLRYVILTLDGKQGTVAVSNNGVKSDLVIPEVLNYGDYTFTVTEIAEYKDSEEADYSFAKNEDIGCVTIPDTVTYIGNRMFYECLNLAELNLGNSVATIGSQTFAGCDALTEIVIPASVTSIGDSVFEDSVSLTSVYFKGNAPEITDPSSVFRNAERVVVYYDDGTTGWTNPWCDRPAYPYGAPVPGEKFSIDHLQYIVLTADYTAKTGTVSVEDEGFIGDLVIPAVVEYNGYTFMVTEVASYGFYFSTRITSITIPDSVISIEGHAFYNCSGLTSITIPNSVTSIGSDVFSGCDSLINISVGTDNQNYSSENGVLFDKNQTTLLQYPSGKEEKSYVIPDGVTSIKSQAFSSCYSLENVTLPDSMTSILGYAFYNCSSLTGITIPNNVTSIGYEAFYGCSSLSNITVEANNRVYSSENGVLFDKDQTALLQYPAGKREKSYVIPDGVTSIEDEAFTGCVSLTSITISDSVTSIGNGAFTGCSSLADIMIPDSVISIGVYAFNNCNSLRSITIPDGVTSIGNNTFNYCTSLMSITLPGSVTSIGSRAFSGCSGLTSVYFEGNAPSAGSNAFSNTPVTIYYQAGTEGWTNPWAGRPTVMIADIDYSLEPDGIVLQWTAEVDAVLQVSDDAVDDWTDVTEGIQTEEGNCIYKVPTTAKQAFYRLKIQ